jgi:pimeloyl-ACP methyl ester carboxylesterase
MAAEWSASGSDPAVLDVVASIILGPADHVPWKTLWEQMPRHRAVQVVDTLLSREDITDRLGEITCPALVIHGNADAAIPVAKAAELASGLPGAWPLVVVEGAGHAANLSHPDEVNAEIRRFLDAL